MNRDNVGIRTLSSGDTICLSGIISATSTNGKMARFALSHKGKTVSVLVRGHDLNAYKDLITNSARVRVRGQYFLSESKEYEGLLVVAHVESAKHLLADSYSSRI